MLLMPKRTISPSIMENSHIAKGRCPRSSIPLHFFSSNIFAYLAFYILYSKRSFESARRQSSTLHSCQTFHCDMSNLRMHVLISLLLVIFHNRQASSLVTVLDAMPIATVAPARGVAAISVTRTTLITTSSISESSASMSTTTAPPLTYNRFGFRRQECFNDQGFRVDCATWTGYYYTWGPPGNPYEGGPGEGGGSGGGGSGYTTVIVGGSSRASTVLPSLVLWATSLSIAIAIVVVWS